nr:protease complex subunit PrcB family protein [uncultured Flavobacterium sp.]
MKKIISLLSLFTIFFIHACKTNASISSAQETAKSNDEIVYAMVYKNQQGTIKTKQTRIITTNEAFTNLITELAIPATDYETILNIDLKKYALVAYFMGEKPSSGFDVKVENVFVTDTKIELTIREIFPAKGDLVADVLTAPYVFIVVPKGKEIVVK